MEKRRSSSSQAVGIAGPLRDLLHAGTSKEKIAPELKDALDLMQLRNLEGLENHFLALDAFLKPWSQFRDSWFLLQAHSSSRASPPGQLAATGVLWFYTCFLEGELRYDARCDDSTSVYTTDETKYGTFDNTHWGVEEYEKMLYAWLLQEFRVGKARNPFGFKYLEHRNVIAAWKNVFVPIINAVRDSYDVRGRKHYGHLATFIEGRFPSRLAFPEGNVATPLSMTPYRMVSVSRTQGARPWPVAPELVSRSNRATTKREYAEFEQELRNVYPKYGQVVERPKFKTRMEDWLAAQKTRAQQKKRAKELQGRKSPYLQKKGGRESPLFGCVGVDETNDVMSTDTFQTAPNNLTPRQSLSTKTMSSSPRSPTSKHSPRTPTRRLPYGMYGSTLVPVEPKEKDLKGNKSMVSPTVSENSPKHSVEYKPRIDRRDSDGIYSMIRDSNPFTDKFPRPDPSHKIKERASWESERSPRYPSAIPKPLFNQKNVARYRGSFEESPFIRAVKEASSVRAPSYEGSGYERDIPPSFIAHKMHATLEHNAYDNNQSAHYPQAVLWPGQSPLEPPIEWLEDGENTPSTPPLPAKNPQRYNSVGGLNGGSNSRHSSLQPPPAIPTLGPRIISVENIRAHLNISPQHSHEDLKEAQEKKAQRTLHSLPLRTYNSHMFPRQVTPVGGVNTRGHEVDEDYEMDDLK